MEQLQNTQPKAPSKAGRFLPKLGLGIVGEIATVFLAFIVFLIHPVNPDETDPGVHFFDAMEYAFIAYCLLRIVCVSEGVRMGGILSGGHRRRLLCYIGTTLGSLLPWATFVYFIMIWYSSSEPFDAALNISFVAALGIPILGLTGAIVGYNLDAKREEKSLAHASEEENPALSSHDAMP